MPASTYSGARGGNFEVSIGSLDDPSKTVYAQYRPKELQIDQSVPWSKHGSTNTAMGNHMWLEFSGAEGRSSTLELFFDASETPNASVEADLRALTELASPTWAESPSSSSPSASSASSSSASSASASSSSASSSPQASESRRPHHCVMVFGRLFNQSAYKCVIESMSTKITMFSPAGAAIRATVNLKLKEANHVGIASPQSTANGGAGGSPASAASSPTAAGSPAGGNGSAPASP